MAEQTEKIVLDVDVSALTKGVEEATAKLIVMKNSLAILDDAMKKGNISTEDYARKSSSLKAEIQATSQQQSAQAKILTQYVAHNNAAAGSVDQLKAELAILTSQYNALSQEERENTEEGKKLAARTKEVNDALKDAGAAVGDFRRDVGNYTGGILKAVDGTGLLATVTAQVEGAQQAWNATLKITKASLGGNISMLKAFKLALAATGIGAVVLLLGGLVSFLTRTQEGLDFVSRATKGFTTVLGVLTDKLSSVGQMIFEAFDNPKQALKDLVGFIETNLMNRLKSFAVIMEGLQKRDFGKINDGIIQLATGITDAEAKTKAFVKELADVAKAGDAIEKENQRIRDAERDLNVERANSRKLVKELNLIAEDTNKSTKEREAAAQKALAIEQDLLNKRKSLQQDVIKNLEKEQALTNNLTADNNKMAEERARLAEIEMESLELQTTLNNKLNTIRQQGLAQQSAILKEALEIQKAYLELDLKQTEEGSIRELEIREAIIQKQLEIENTGAEVSRERRLLNEKKANQELLELRDEYFQKMEIKYREFSDKVIGPISKEDVEKQINALQQRLEAQQWMNEAMAESEHELQRTKVDAIAAGVDAMKGFFGEQSEAAKAFYLVQKGFAIADIIMNLQTEIAKIASANAILGPAGIPLTVAQTVAAKIRAGIGIGTIAAQTIQEFTMARGGVIDGPSHAAGGVKGTGRFANVEVEGGEAVINKNSTAIYKDLLSQINMAGGGKPLSINRFMAAGGLTAAPAPVFPMMRQGDTLAASEIRRLGNEIKQLKLQVSVVDINRAQNKAEVKRGKTDI